jgi:hypothetical protein
MYSWQLLMFEGSTLSCWQLPRSPHHNKAQRLQ